MSDRMPSDREIKQQVIDLVEWGRNHYGIPERCRGRTACMAMGLQVVVEDQPFGRDGMLDRKGTVVVSASIEWESRVEYTIFHEIIHHLLEEEADFYERLAATFADDQPALIAAIERCCQLGAAEFMIPSARVHALIAEYGFSVDLIERLAGINGASIVASATQLAAYAPVECYVVVCRHDVSPAWPHNVTLFVEQAAKHTEGEFPIARGKMIPPDHLFHYVWDNKHPMQGMTYFPFRSGSRYPGKYGEAKMIGGQVVGILYEGNPPRKGQLTMELPL